MTRRDEHFTSMETGNRRRLVVCESALVESWVELGEVPSWLYVIDAFLGMRTRFDDLGLRQHQHYRTPEY